MKFFSTSIVLIFLFSFTSILYSQERTITGFVTTLENIPVVNAEVKVLSSKETVLTDTIGNFKVSCLLNDKIKINTRGFYSQKVKIDEKTNEVFVNLILRPGEKNLEIAAGYGHIREKDKSLAISNVENNNNKFSIYTNLLEYIIDSSPSISLSNGGLIIRGAGSLLGSNAAMILLDGQQVNTSQLSQIPPSDVKSFDVLKGSAAAMYGVRGANGVVLITTKTGGESN
ncbi:hypothetical protein MTsPCn9_23540 [Croceitalea sp. MTPC9]|uniref:TonB-dependent receptor plug domain-containing protein n=1 Tax=unclassified Croceitalea TaxID=2632280 RepID=UPI002B3D759C|nr:hypothetical protein MTsPCn6_20000 [Croceitalea sp. MTPC6]GMN17416.1 hypothetical protein MTsPCn9_23540 [Croceitalea sp. MTPC9]